MVSFHETSQRGNQLPFTNFPRTFAGDICVLQHLTNLTEFYVNSTKIAGKFPRDFPARVTSYPKSCFCERSSGDIGVLANCKDLSVFNAFGSNITGKFPRNFPAR